jgi:tetratricopeptide (TPR) repeat protein
MTDGRTQMTTDDVRILRKSGKLAEALELGRRLYAECPDDPFSVRELAWCLYDEIKQLQRGSNDVELDRAKNELRSLDLPTDEWDKILLNCVNRILDASPEFETCLRATEISKAGKHREAIQLMRPLAKSAEATPRIVESYGWNLYRKMRDAEGGRLSDSRWCLNEFQSCWKEDWPPNSKLFTYLLIEAFKHAETWQEFVPFVEHLGLERIDPSELVRPHQDYEPFQSQLLKAIHESLKKHRHLRVARPALQKLLTAWKDSFEDGKFSHYHLGRILLWTGGDLDQARALLLKAVRENPDEYWRWQALADALGGPELKIVLSKAVCCAAEEESHKIPLFKKYADLLAAEGELGPASASIKEAIRLCGLSGKEWRDSMPPWYQVDNADESNDILEYARPYSERADEILADGLEACVCAILRPLESEGRFLCAKGDGKIITLKFRKGLNPDPNMVAIKAIFLEREHGVSNVLAWEACTNPNDLGFLQTGVVFETRMDKNFVSVATPSQSFMPIYFDHWPSAKSLAVGDCINLWWMRLEGEKSHVLWWKQTKREEQPCFFEPIRGVFTQAPDRPHGLIDFNGVTIFVHPSDARRLQRGHEIQGWAVRLKDKVRGQTWRLVLSHP